MRRWFADFGAEVKSGQVLAQIDPRPYKAALDQAEGQLARDGANLADVQLDLQRHQYLVKQNEISAQQFTTQQAVDVNIGLKDGDKVIDNPPDSLRPGDLVKTAATSSAS